MRCQVAIDRCHGVKLDDAFAEALSQDGNVSERRGRHEIVLDLIEGLIEQEIGEQLGAEAAAACNVV